MASSDLLRKRSRHWASVACAGAAAGGALMLVQGHMPHGVLLLVASALLFKGSVFMPRRVLARVRQR